MSAFEWIAIVALFFFAILLAWLGSKDRRWLFLGIAVYVIVPLLHTFGLPKIEVTGEVRGLYDFVENVDQARVELVVADGPRTCPWMKARPARGGLERGPMTPSERFVCDPRRPWLWVGATVLQDLEHAIEFVKKGEKTEAWQIDGITGATISSKTVAAMVNDSAQKIIPLVVKHLDQFKEAK